MEENADNPAVKYSDVHLRTQDEAQNSSLDCKGLHTNLKDAAAASSVDDAPSSIQSAKNSAGDIGKSIDNAPADTAGLDQDDNRQKTEHTATVTNDDESHPAVTTEKDETPQTVEKKDAKETALMTPSVEECTIDDDHVSQTSGKSVQPPAADADGPPAPLTEATLAENSKKQENDTADNAAPSMSTNSAIRAWAATLPEVPDSVKDVNVGPAHIFEIQPTKEEEHEETAKDEPRIQETKDVFTDTQKIAYVGLCALTSLEVVHDFEGKDFTYARMSAGNWQRKLMRMLYAHMDISNEEIKMIESLSTHKILPTDLVHQFVAQGETATVDMTGFHKVRQERSDYQKPAPGLNNERTSESDSGHASSTGNRESMSSDKSGKTERESKASASQHTATPSSTCDEKDGQFIIDLRWTVMCDLLLLCLSLESYDARSRVFIARMASYLSLDWFQVIKFEKRIAEHLLQDAASAWETETVTSVATTQTSATDLEVSVRNDAEREGRNRQRRKRRYVMIGLATIGGGLILGLSAGLMAPVIAGGLGTILTTVGVTGTSGFLGGTAGIALITGGATTIGGGLGAKSMKRRMKTINTFEFSQVNADDNVSCIVTIAGWLPKGGGKDAAALPFTVLDPVMGDHYSLFWEPEMLEALGSAFKIFATEVVAFSIQQALTHTIMGALLAGLAWPLALTKLGYLVDNPWNNGLDRARLAGLILADSLMNRNLGARPVTLVGYSLGARVIFFCLLELARVNAYGLVENVALFGTPVSASKSQWKECTTVVSGRFINGYATSDWLLGFLFRASTAGLGNVAGLRALEHIEGNRVQNIDCTDLVKGHLNYRTAMPKLLKRAGFVVTSEELPNFVKEREVDKELELDLSGADDLKTCRPATMAKGTSVSSLSSGKASIQYPPPKPQSASPTSISSPPRTSNSNNDNNIQSPPEPERNEDTNQPYNGSIDQPAAPTPDTQISQTQTTPSSLSPKAKESDDAQPAPAPDSNTNNNMPDEDIIADILAKAAAVSKTSGKKYSSLSSGRASIQTRSASPKQSISESTLISESERNSSPSIDDGNNTSSSRSSSFIFSKPSSLFKGKKKYGEDDSGQRELSEAGIEVKEIKSTLGRMVVPDDVVNPMPKITLEKPQYARINR